MRWKKFSLWGLAIGVLYSMSGASQTCLTPFTLQAMKDGKLSPVQQFVAINECMDNCVREALRNAPGYMEPYVSAVPKFTRGQCVLEGCYQEVNLLTILPLVSGAFDQNYAQKFMASVLASQSNSRCGRTLDPLWIQLIAGKR